MICTPHQIFFSGSQIKKYLMGGACGTSGAEQSCIDVFWGNTEGRHNFGIYWSTVLKWILNAVQ
jgi:hypothetical protein